MKHEIVANRIEHVAMATGIIAGLSAAGSVLAEPSGFTAIGVWLGVVDEPWIIRLEPIFSAVATVFGTLSGLAYFVAQWKKRRASRVNSGQ